MPRVAYIHSPQLQAVADHLPANLGRSSIVHSLVRALDLLTDEPEPEASESGRAIVVPPEEELGSRDSLRRYHDQAYVGSCVPT